MPPDLKYAEKQVHMLVNYLIKLSMLEAPKGSYPRGKLLTPLWADAPPD